MMSCVSDVRGRVWRGGKAQDDFEWQSPWTLPHNRAFLPVVEESLGLTRHVPVKAKLAPP